MKKIFFTLIGSLLIGFSGLQAQQRNDTTGTASESRTQQQDRPRYDQSRDDRDRTKQDRDQAWQQESDKNQNRDAYANEGMVIIEKHEIPASLKETLKDEKYAGWENGTIYHNTNTGEYVIAPRAYRFDESGKEIEMQGAPAYGDAGNRQGQYQGAQDRNQPGQQPDRTRESQDAQQQAKDQMGEIPTSAPEDQRDDNAQPDQSRAYEPGQQTDQAADQQDNQQQPSTGYRSGQTDRSAEDQSQPGQPSDNQYRTDNMVEIQAEQIPASLRRTLNERKYQGWEENGTLYQDPSTSEYVLVMEKTEDGSQPRQYRFDKNGQLKKDQDDTGQK